MAGITGSEALDARPWSRPRDADDPTDRSAAPLEGGVESWLRAMPRTPIEPQFKIEYLSILDADGRLDETLVPPLSPDDLKRLYRAMLLGRRLDE